MLKRSRFIGLCLALLGSLVLLNNLSKPRIESSGLHGSDIAGLVASGMLLGVGVMGLLGRIRTWG